MIRMMRNGSATLILIFTGSYKVTEFLSLECFSLIVGIERGDRFRIDAPFERIMVSLGVRMGSIIPGSRGRMVSGC